MTPRFALALATAAAASAPLMPGRPALVRHAATPADSLLGVFEGRTPCGPIAADFTGFRSPNCEKIKWRLTLYRNPASGNPATYVFKGSRAARQGPWRAERVQGCGRGRAVYRLDYDTPAKLLELLSVDDRVLLLLDRDGEVIPGDASWSYALSRTGPTEP